MSCNTPAPEARPQVVNPMQFTVRCVRYEDIHSTKPMKGERREDTYSGSRANITQLVILNQVAVFPLAEISCAGL